MKKLITLLLLLLSLAVYSQKFIEYTATDNTTHTLNLAQYNNYLFIKGSPTLTTGSYIFTKTGSPVNGMLVTIYWNATVTYSGANVVTIFGTNLTPVQASKKGIITCYYNNVAWVVNYIPNFVASGVIDSAYFNANNFGNGIKKESGITLRIDTTTSIGFKGTSPNKTMYLKYDDSTLTAYGTNKLLRARLNTATGLTKAVTGIAINYDDTTIHAYGSGYKLRVKANGIDSTRIKNAHISFNKLTNITAGNFIIGNTINRPALFNGTTVHRMMIGTGTTVSSAPVYGAISMSYSSAGGGRIISSIADDSVLIRHLDDTLKREILTFWASFDSLDCDTTKIMFNYRCKITRVYLCVMSPLADYDVGTIQFFNNAGAIVNDDMWTWNVPKAAAVGYAKTSPTITTVNTFEVGDYLRIFTQKGYNGGKVLVTIHLMRQY